MGTHRTQRTMPVLATFIVLALVALTLASSSSSSSTSHNRRKKEFYARNRRDFQNRLATAVSKAIVENNADIDLRPFLKTYGEKSDAGTFDKTFELLNALADKRKRDVESSSSASSLSLTNVDGNTFYANLSPAEKDALRKAVLKQALIHHLKHGRGSSSSEASEAKEDVFARFEEWAAINADVIGELDVESLKSDLFTTSSD